MATKKEDVAAFAKGDTVKLKSGGPDMTVTEISNNLQIFHCAWFAGKKLERGSFPSEALMPIVVAPEDK